MADEPRFRDLNHNGTMEPYEDPSLPVEVRVDDLVSRMTLEEKAGLLFHTILHPGPEGSVAEGPGGPGDRDARTMRRESAATLVTERLLSHFNVPSVLAPRAHAEWHNRVQELAARTRLGIPVTLSSDPRHGFATLGAAFAARGMSQWPEAIGFGAIGDPELAQRYGDAVRKEYVAVGLRVALHPMADLATEPRWSRIAGTFGEDAELAAALAAAYIRGLRGGDSLGSQSVASMVKHFPGGGPQLDGEDPHFAYGREQVYPGGRFDYHLIPFEAALAAGVTQVMPYYGMPVGTEHEEVGFGYNRGVITGLLRERYGFDGIVCTDWALVSDHQVREAHYPGRAWGVEHLSREERIQKILEAGCDQLGGESCPELVVSLVRSGRVSEGRLDISVARILREKFVLGLFDDPFVDPEAVERVVDSDDLRAQGLAAQRRSCTLLQNGEVDGHPLLPLAEGTRLFCSGVDPGEARRYGTVVDVPSEADVALVRLATPFEPRDDGGIERFFHAGSLDFAEDTIRDLAQLSGAAPATVVDVLLERPAVLREVVPLATALVGTYGVSDAALLDVLFGRAAPEEKLPFELPSSMDEVRASRPDVPSDSAHPLFPVGFGLRY